MTGVRSGLGVLMVGVGFGRLEFLWSRFRVKVWSFDGRGWFREVGVLMVAVSSQGLEF